MGSYIDGGCAPSTEDIGKEEDAGAEQGILFKEENCRLYLLKVTAKNASNGHVAFERCRFCVVFGLKTKSSAKRCATEHSKFFRHPFLSENYVVLLKTTRAQR
eukprot:IDg13349t1